MEKSLKIAQNSIWEENRDNTFAISTCHPALSRCREMKEELTEILRRSSCRKWLIVCLLIGEREETAEPALLIIANEKVDLPYQSKHGISINFEQGEIELFSPASAINAQYEQPIRAGSSCSGDSDAPGTIGGFFLLQDRTIVGITNAHVLTNSRTLEGKVHQPAVEDYTYKMQSLRDEISQLREQLETRPFLELRINKYQEQLTRYQELQKSQAFLCGNYMHGKLERKPGQPTLDYAIFSIDPGRPNPTNNLSATRPGYPAKLEPSTQTLDQVAKDCGRVFKVGRSTGFTIGRMNSEQALIKLDNVETKEYIAVGNDNSPFARGGDSGSIVCDEDGSICGLVWGGNVCKNIAFVSSLDMVLSSLHEDGYDLTLSTR